ncbi:hypothetical protein D3C72_1639890 [compost metagenome]
MRVAVDGAHGLAHLYPGTYDEIFGISDSDHRGPPNLLSWLHGISAKEFYPDLKTVASSVTHLGTKESPASSHLDNHADTLSEEIQRSSAKTILPEISKFEVEQQFEGVVLSRDEISDTFTARLRDTRGLGPDEEAEFSLSELPDDAHLIMPGAMFTWIIGLQWRGGQSKRVSEVRFRRLPPFTKDAISEAKQRAEQRAKLFAEFDE